MAPAYFIYLLKAYCFQPIPTPTENGHAGTRGFSKFYVVFDPYFPFLTYLCRSTSLCECQPVFFGKLCKTGRHGCSGVCHFFGTVCIHGTDSTATVSSVPIYERSLSCLLGSQLLGALCWRRSRFDYRWKEARMGS